MNSLHPHWKATDAESDPSPKKKAGIPAQGKSVSRLPAAVIGMLVAGTVGVVFVGGVENLRGQLLDYSVVIVNTEGLEPQEINAERGKDIVWESRDALPHTFRSSSLCDEDRNCLDTDLLFEYESVRYTVPRDIPDGVYEYASTTAPDITGSIIIGDIEPVAADTEEPAEGAAGEEVPLENTPVIEPSEDTIVPSIEDLPDINDPIMEDFPSVSDPIIEDTPVNQDDLSYIEDLLSAVTGQDASEGLSLDDLGAIIEENQNNDIAIEAIQDDPAIDFIDSIDPTAGVPQIRVDLPRNPYVVGSVTSYTPPNGDVLHAGAPERYVPPVVTTHKPLHQPETGATFWFVLFSSIGGLLLWLKRNNKTERLVSQ